jgi:hypothetical protein
LALFTLDCREGITYNDVALYKWLTYHRLKLPSEGREKREMSEKEVKDEEERYMELLKEEEKYQVKKDLTYGGTVMHDPSIPAERLEKSEFDKKAFLRDQK